MEKFVVSARKYRPSNFRSVVGQEHITSTLVNAISRGQLSHAYLFCGPRGVGKTTCARIIAKAINCLSPNSDHEACGTCTSCKGFDENSSFNIYELDAASNNSVDYIRSLNEQVRIPPQIGKYSIYIIDEVHMLSTSAFNAFLKTLEEPPKHVIFILATTEKHKILPTILSRCQVYEFKHISVNDVVQYLKYISSEEGVTYDEESLNIIAQKADGCMRDALSMFDKVVTFCNSNLELSAVSSGLNLLDYDTYFSFVDTLIEGDYKESLLIFDKVLRKGFDPISFLSGLSNHLRDLVMASDSTTVGLLGVSEGLTSRYISQSSRCNISFIFKSLEIIGAAESNIRYSLNQRLTTELSILKICDSKQSLNKEDKDTPQVVVEPKKEPKKAKEEVNPEVIEVEEKKEAEKEVEETKIAPTKPVTSSLGIPSLSNITSAANNYDAEQNKKQEDVDISSLDFTIDVSQHDTVLKACKLFSDKIIDRNPRVALSFENARITDDKLVIPVYNNITLDEIAKQKSKTCEYLSKLADIKVIGFEIELEDIAEEKKILLLKSEDKYKFLIEENKALIDLSDKLGLNFTS